MKRIQKALSILALAVLIGCGHLVPLEKHSANDWPQLRVVEHDENLTTVISVCGPPRSITQALTWPPLGCTFVNFDENRCDIWFVAEWARRMEREHCEGGDHDGTLTRAYQEWKVKILNLQPISSN